MTVKAGTQVGSTELKGGLLGGVVKSISGRCEVGKGLETGSYAVSRKTEKPAAM